MEETQASVTEQAENAEQTAQADVTQEKTPETDVKSVDQELEELMIPKSRFDKVNNRYKSVKAELEEYEAMYKSVEDKFSELTAKYEEQAEAMEQQIKRTEQLEKVINNLIESKLSKIPEEYHDLIPGNLEVDQKLDWIMKAEEKGLFSSALNVGTLKIGEPTNPKQKKSVDYSKMSTFQLLTMGYGSKG